MMPAPIKTDAMIDNNQGVSTCDCTLSAGSGLGSLPVWGTPGTPLTCAGTSSIFGVPLARPTAKILVTVFFPSVSVRGSAGIPGAILIYALPLLIHSVESSCHIAPDFDLSIKDQRPHAILDNEMHSTRRGYCSYERTDQAQTLEIASNAVPVLAHLHQVQLRGLISHRYIADSTRVRRSNGRIRESLPFGSR